MQSRPSPLLFDVLIWCGSPYTDVRLQSKPVAASREEKPGKAGGVHVQPSKGTRADCRIGRGRALFTVCWLHRVAEWQSARSTFEVGFSSCRPGTAGTRCDVRARGNAVRNEWSPIRGRYVGIVCCTSVRCSPLRGRS